MDKPYTQCRSLLTTGAHKWKNTRHSSYDGEGEADYICEDCGLVKQEDWNAYSGSVKYSYQGERVEYSE